MFTEKQLLAIADQVTEYVTDEHSGSIIGALVYRHKRHYVLAVVHEPRIERMIACAEFKTRKQARNAASTVLNADRPVNIAPIM